MSDEMDRRRPAPGSVVELFFTSRGDPQLSWCDDLPGDDLVVSAPLDRMQRPIALEDGEQIEVVWRDDDGLRALPVVLVSIELGERPRWLLREAGEARRGQRRDAVRAPMHIPVRVGPEIGAHSGSTVDVSEGGMRCLLEPDGDAAVDPATGDVVRVSVLFPDSTVTCLAEVIRRHERDDPRMDLSVRFIGLTEHQQDVLRRRVFARLRELRTRGLI